MNIAPIDQQKLAKTDEEYLNLLLSDADWIVRTPEDVRQLRASGEGPLAKLPEDDFEEFLSNLQFKADGVAGGYYKPLMATLSMKEIFQVFEYFGMSNAYALDTHDSKCVADSCEFDFFHFCPTSVCHHVVKEE